MGKISGEEQLVFGSSICHIKRGEKIAYEMGKKSRKKWGKKSRKKLGKKCRKKNARWGHKQMQKKF